MLMIILICVLQTVFPIETSKKTTGLLGFVIFSMVLPSSNVFPLFGEQVRVDCSVNASE